MKMQIENSTFLSSWEMLNSKLLQYLSAWHQPASRVFLTHYVTTDGSAPSRFLHGTCKGQIGLHKNDTINLFPWQTCTYAAGTVAAIGCKSIFRGVLAIRYLLFLGSSARSSSRYKMPPTWLAIRELNHSVSVLQILTLFSPPSLANQHVLSE